MEKVRAKKHLGQHFLNDTNIAKDIVDALSNFKEYKNVLEVGPGMGVLTEFLITKPEFSTWLIEIDKESVVYLEKKYPDHKEKIIYGDFLKLRLDELFKEKFAVIGNFPYNISSQIFFKVLEHRNQIPEVVGMLQKEVAERLASKHGKKAYGILSVFLQTFYDVEYLFTVHEHVFTPPPKVKSAVIRVTRNQRESLDCDEKLFFKVVKQSFSTRRKTLRNALKVLNLPVEFTSTELFDKRAEQLSIEDFIQLTKDVERLTAS